MENLSAQTVQSFCRACLKELKPRQKYKITSLNIQIRQWLEYESIENPLTNDNYPNSICHPCRNKLNDFLKFYEMCKKSKLTLQRIIESDDESKSHTIPKANKVEATELEENMLAFEIFETEQENIIKTEPNLNEAESNEISINNNDEVTVNDNTIKICEDENDIDEEDEHDESFKNSSESEEIPTDSDCEDTSTNTKSKLSTTKEKKKKYSYSFRCDQCKYRCVSQQTLDIHLRTHYGLKPYQCKKCNDAFDKSNLLLKHLNEKHGEKDLDIICEHEECGRQFKSTRSYKNHYRQKHIPESSNQKQDKTATKSPYRHVCEECGKMYAKLQYFREHQYTHGPKELYPYQCDQCDKAFVKQRTFNEHKLRHAGIKNFECSYCGAKKTTQKELRSHLNSHTRERQYPCPTCSMVFYRSSNRRIHVEVVHQGIRRFTCRFCEQTFGKSDHLKNHELLHTGEKPHSCTVCGKRFVQKVSLKSHMKTHNK